MLPLVVIAALVVLAVRSFAALLGAISTASSQRHSLQLLTFWAVVVLAQLRCAASSVGTAHAVWYSFRLPLACREAGVVLAVKRCAALLWCAAQERIVCSLVEIPQPKSGMTAVES